MVEWGSDDDLERGQPVVTLIEKTYDKGVRIAKAAFKAVESRLQRDKTPQSIKSSSNLNRSNGPRITNNQGRESR